MLATKTRRAKATVLALAAASVLVPATASAFCRQKTCDAKDCLVDSDGCIAEGDDLFYDVPCLSFAIDEGSAEPLGLSDQEMEEIVAEAFEAWRGVECPQGGHPGFAAASVGIVPAEGIFFCEEETLNVGVWTFDPAWDHRSSSLGYTTSTYVVGTGEVYDADVELNLRRIANIADSQDIREAVLSVATHEAGHVLGLAHSDERTAVMAESYSDLTARPLTTDDIAGICELYPPDGVLECSAPGVSEAAFDEDACIDAQREDASSTPRCSFSARRSSPPVGLSLLLFGCWLARKRSSQRRR